jgi:hypothetical protein
VRNFFGDDQSKFLFAKALVWILVSVQLLKRLE